MKKFRKLLVAAAFACTALLGFAKNEIEFIDFYDGLVSKRGQAGHWFVRDAGNKSTGQHGDPTVPYGWAMYTWDFRKLTWIKICAQHAIEGGGDTPSGQYVTLQQFNDTVSTLNQDISDAKVYADSKAAEAQNAAIEKAGQLADTAESNADTYTDGKVSSALDEAKKYTDGSTNSVVVTAKALDDEILRLAKEYTDSKQSGLDTNEVIRIAGELDAVVEARINIRIDDQITSLSNNVTRAISTGDNATLAAAKSYTDEKCTGVDTNVVKDIAGELDVAVKEESKSYTDQQINVHSNIFETIISNESVKVYADMRIGNENTLEAAKKYHDEHRGLNTNEVEDVAGELDDEVKTELSQKITVVSNLTVVAGTKAQQGIDDAAVAKAIADSNTEHLETVDSDIVDIRAKIASVYHFKGSCNYADLPTEEQQNADVWYVTDREESFAWIETRNEWVPLGKKFDLSHYYTKTETETEIGKGVAVANEYTDDALSNFRVDKVIFGEGASNANPLARSQIILGPNKDYPSVAYDSYNILLGIDSQVGYGFTEGKATRYAAAIGTSNRAKYMHSYAFGSQLNSLSPNSTTIGYGLTAYHDWSTVIGHGNRSINDKHFDTVDQLKAFFSDPECTNTIFVGYGVLVGSGPGCSHIVDAVLTEPNADGLYATLRLDPLDIEVGQRRWDYGKSHGRGTFNIVARGNGVDYGPAFVYINDKNLLEWFGINIGQPTDKEIYNKGIFGPGTSHCDHDYTIAIGDNAKALETASSCQAIAIGRDALSAGSATVAVGPNAFAYGSLSSALGWRANAVGQHSIAIGSAKKSGQNYFVDGVVNTNSDLCVAVGDDAIAIGFNTKAYKNKSVAVGYYATANADSAVQIGMGTNDAPKSVKFYDTTVFKDGKLVGAFNPEDLDPKKVPIDVVTADEVVITCMPHRVNTLTSVTNLGVGTECYLQPTGSRNYDVFIPNKPEFRCGMPITLDIEIDNCTATFMDDKNQIFHLPAMVHVQQPDDDMILFTVKELKDKKYDWKPVVTNINIKFDLVAGKFFTEGNKSLEGYNLHAATAYKITYPISATDTATADLVKVGTSGICSGTYFEYAASVDFTPPADKKIFFTGSKSWFEITYTTHDGTAVIERQEISN